MLLRRPRSLTATQAADALRRGELQLIDVREPAEFDRDRPIAFLCRSGSRSAMAARVATKAGLDAANVKGGVIAWSRAGLPLSVGSNRGVA